MEALASPIDSGTSSLTFTFVPSIGTLPSEVLLAKESYCPPKIVGHNGTLMEKPQDVYEKSLEKNMHESPQNAVYKPTYGNNLLQEELTSNYSENPKQNDLFIAEFVVVMDLDGDEEKITDKKSQALPFEKTKYEFRKTLRESPGQPKATLLEFKPNESYVPGSQEDCRNVKDQEPQKIGSVPSGLDSYSPQLLTFSHPDRTEKYRRQIPANIHKPKTAVKETFHTPFSSQKSNSFHTLTTESPASLSTRRSLYSPIDLEMSEHNFSKTSHSGRLGALSPLPIQVIKYPLCRSPSPMNSPFFGSSSTICSLNENPSPVPKSDAASPVPSRLSFLTSLLKSNRSCPKRTISPDEHKSEPRTTLTVPSDTPRKALSCVSLNYPRESKMPHFQRTAELMPSASESDISQGELSFQQSPNRILSIDPVHLKPSKSSLPSQKVSVSPSSPLHRRSNTPMSSSKENNLTISDKPPISRPYTPTKKYPVLGKSKRVTLFPPPLNFDQTLCHIPDERKSDMSPLKRCTSPRGHLKLTTHENFCPGNVMSSFSIDIGKNHDLHQTHSAPLCHETMETDQVTYQSWHPNHSSHSYSLQGLSRKNEPLCSLSTNITAQPRSILSRSWELPTGSSLPLVSDLENKKLFKIKSRYKDFAAIPTNTLLLDQKALDEPEINRRNCEAEEKTDTHTEMCSPALLRQQTEEICAAIDEVLHDPLPPHCNFASRSPKLKPEKKSAYMPRAPMKSAGRETKYATLQPLPNTKATHSQMTRPGVIRPVSAKDNEDRKFHPNLFQQFSMPPYKRE
ncbi:muscular LMNA-interacting protein isoform X2 [Dendropsophus ebraccatus]